MNGGRQGEARRGETTLNLKKIITIRRPYVTGVLKEIYNHSLQIYTEGVRIKSAPGTPVSSAWKKMAEKQEWLMFTSPCSTFITCVLSEDAVFSKSIKEQQGHR